MHLPGGGVGGHCIPKDPWLLASAAADPATLRLIPAARAINERLMGLHTKLFVEANPIPVKWALSAMGLIQDEIRLPLSPLSPQFHGVVRAALVEAGCVVESVAHA